MQANLKIFLILKEREKTILFRVLSKLSPDIFRKILKIAALLFF